VGSSPLPGLLSGRGICPTNSLASMSLSDVASHSPRCGCATFGISHLGLCSHIPYLGTCSHLYIHPYHYHYHYTPTCTPVEVSRTSPYGDESGFVLSQCLAALPSVNPKSRSTTVDEHQPPPRIVNSFPRKKPLPRIINPFPCENLPIL
jgi:hypothetical protein